MTSIFGSFRRLFQSKEKTGQPTRITKYEDEIKLLLDTVVLSNPSVLGAGFAVFGPCQSAMPTLSEAMRCGKNTIKSLCELLIGMAYVTEKGTIVLRVSVDDVVLGGGKIQLPVLLEDWEKSKNVTQFCMRGSLHPDTLIIAVENFTQKRVREGLLLCEQTKKSGKLIFDFAQLQSGSIYATPEDHIMLERATEPPYINFTFGRNLFWYAKSKKDTSSNKENGFNANGSKVKILSPYRSQGGKGQKSVSDVPLAMLDPVNGVPVPPPPPPGMIRHLVLDANGIPICGTPPPAPGKGGKHRKVRQLHWNKIPQNQLSGTIWKEKGSPSRLAVDIDQDELEDMFSLSPMKDSQGNAITFNLKAEKTNVRPSLLDLKRANNGAVLLSQFKMDYDEIRNALLTMDTANQLTIENLISLKYLFPLVDQERRDLLDFKGDIKTCGPAEQFYLKTLGVPRPDVRIRMLIFRYQYYEVLESLVAGIDILTKGSQELIESDKLAQVLQLILKIGRALNGAQASGFRLDSLSKLADTKAKDKKTSILDYLLIVAFKQKPELLEFWTDLPYLEHVSRLATETIVEGLKEIKDTLDALNLELELIAVNMTPAQESQALFIMSQIHSTKDSTNSEASSSSTDNEDETSNIPASDGTPIIPVKASDGDAYFKAHMAPFYEKSLAVYQTTKKRHDVAVQAFEKAVKYFGEDPRSAQPGAFFSLISSFVENWKASKSKLEKAHENKLKAEAKAAKEAEKAELKKKELEAKQTIPTSNDTTQIEASKTEAMDTKSLSTEDCDHIEAIVEPEASIEPSVSIDETFEQEFSQLWEDAPADSIQATHETKSSSTTIGEILGVIDEEIMPMLSRAPSDLKVSLSSLELNVPATDSSSLQSKSTPSLITAEWRASVSTFLPVNIVPAFTTLEPSETAIHPLQVVESEPSFLEF